MLTQTRDAPGWVHHRLSLSTLKLSYGSEDFDLAVSQIVGDIIPKNREPEAHRIFFRVAIRDCARREVDKESHATHRRGVW